MSETAKPEKRPLHEHPLAKWPPIVATTLGVIGLIASWIGDLPVWLVLTFVGVAVLAGVLTWVVIFVRQALARSRKHDDAIDKLMRMGFEISARVTDLDAQVRTALDEIDVLKNPNGLSPQQKLALTDVVEEYAQDNKWETIFREATAKGWEGTRTGSMVTFVGHGAEVTMKADAPTYMIWDELDRHG